MKALIMGTICLLVIATSLEAQDTKVRKTDAGPSDSQISKIMLNSSNSEIELSKLAQSNSANPDVKRFAEKMINDHADNMNKTVDVTSKMKSAPTESPRSAELQMKTQSDLNKLKDLKGKEFDQEFIKNQVTTHQKLLDELDKKLIPEADNKELKAHLQATRNKVQNHLKEAQQIQRSL